MCAYVRACVRMCLCAILHIPLHSCIWRCCKRIDAPCQLLHLSWKRLRLKLNGICKNFKPQPMREIPPRYDSVYGPQPHGWIVTSRSVMHLQKVDCLSRLWNPRRAGGARATIDHCSGARESHTIAQSSIQLQSQKAIGVERTTIPRRCFVR